MRSMNLDDATPPQSLTLRQTPIPTVAGDEILIRVHAAGVTPTELEWYPTTHHEDGSPRSGAIPGHEFSGMVEAVGPDAAGFLVGQEVFGLNDWFSDGATADYCLTTPSAIALKPARLTHVEAASVPIGALTARQGLTRARLFDGERVLIHGGAGAVGVYAIQIAKLAGAQVFTTASARHADFLEHLGADHVIDYKTERFEDKLRDLDVVFDCVGGETLRRSWAVLKNGGRMVSIAAEGENAQDERTKNAFFIVEANYTQLTEIANLFDRSKLKAFVDGTVPLEQAEDAYFGRVPRPMGRGKVVINVAGSPP